MDLSISDVREGLIARIYYVTLRQRIFWAITFVTLFVYSGIKLCNYRSRLFDKHRITATRDRRFTRDKLSTEYRFITDLDPSVLNGKDSGQRVLSLREYLSSINYHGDGSIRNMMRKALLTYMNKPEIVDFLLIFLPSSLQQDGPLNTLSNWLRTTDWLALPNGLTGAAIAENYFKIIHDIAPPSDTKSDDQQNLNPTQLLAQGGSVSPEILKIIDEYSEISDMIRAVKEHVERNPSTDAPRLIPCDKDLFPDLYIGAGGLSMKQTKLESLQNELFACILCRLTSNLLKTQDLFSITIGGSAPIFSIEIFIRTLQQEFDCNIEAFIATDYSNFGLNLCLKEDDHTIYPVALGFGVHTGFVDPDDNSPIKILATHASLTVDIQCPLLSTNWSVQSYMGVEGFTGWHANNNWEFPWSPNTNVNTKIAPEKHIDAFNIAAILSASICSTAVTEGWPMGGYGMLGVCNDSAAFIEAALIGTTTLFPLVSNPIARTILLKSVKEISKKNHLEQYARPLCHSIATIPSDVAAPPRESIERIPRILKSTIAEDSEWISPFTEFRHLKDKLTRVRVSLESMSIV